MKPVQNPRSRESSDVEDHELMGAAIAIARLAAAAGEVPIGAVVAVEGRVVAAAGNDRESARDPTGHAELIAVREAARRLGRWRLTGATVYATIEPCPMCAGALVNARIDRLVYGAPDPKAGAVRSLYAIADDGRLNHRVEVVPGIRAGECAELVRAFFRQARRARSAAEPRGGDPSRER